jgi:hypothetical protein
MQLGKVSRARDDALLSVIGLSRERDDLYPTGSEQSVSQTS